MNGGWIAHNPIPAAYPSWGRINELAEHNRDVLHDILESRAANKSATLRLDRTEDRGLLRELHGYDEN